MTSLSAVPRCTYMPVGEPSRQIAPSTLYQFHPEGGAGSTVSPMSGSGAPIGGARFMGPDGMNMPPMPAAPPAGDAPLPPPPGPAPLPPDEAPPPPGGVPPPPTIV